MKKQQYVIFAKSSGVEIAPGEKRSEGRATEGRIILRFFKLEEGATSIRFVVEPWEAYELSRKMDRVCQEGGKDKLTHKFESSAGEVSTTLSVERWERNGKSGCAMSLQRDKDTVNVPADEPHFLFAAEYLRFLSTSQCWVEPTENRS